MRRLVACFATVLFLASILAITGCEGPQTRPSAQAQSPAAFSLADLNNVLSATYTPKESTIMMGTSFTFGVTRQATPSNILIVYGAVLVRDDGMDVFLDCGSAVGGIGSWTGYGSVDPTQFPIFVRGRTVRLVLVAQLADPKDGDRLTRPCIFPFKGPDGLIAPGRRVDWSQVKWQRDVTVWSVE